MSGPGGPCPDLVPATRAALAGLPVEVAPRLLGGVLEVTVGGETVSVSTADAIVGGDEFAAALLAALEKLSADETAQTVLRLYDGDGVRYSGADTQAVEFAQYLLGNTEGVYQLTSE